MKENIIVFLIYLKKHNLLDKAAAYDQKNPEPKSPARLRAQYIRAHFPVHDCSAVCVYGNLQA